jgi:ABC-2 type transport system permease protein
MTRIFMQAEKEWSSFRRDRLGLALAVILPLATLLLFGYGVRLENHNIPVIVRDLDASRVSRKLTTELLSSQTLRSVSSGQSDAIGALKRGEAKAEIVIPQGFESKIKAGGSANFQALVDGCDVSSAETIRQVVALVSLKTGSNSIEPDLHSLFVVPDVEIWFNPDAQEAPFIVSGVFAIVLWMYPALLAAVAIARELEHETIVQVYASGLSAAEFLLGKGVVYASVGMILAVLMMVLSHFLFGLNLAGDAGLLSISTFIYVMAAVAFGLFAGVVTREENVAVQATATGGFFPALLLSGFVYPLANVPFPINLVAYIVPARYYIEVCRDVFMRATGWHEMWWRVVLIAGFGLIFFAGAWSGLKHMQLED